MDVKEAIRLAKEHFAQIFAEELLQNISLEEIDTDADGRRRITLSFSRPHTAGGIFTRYYKVVTLNPDGSLHSIKNRELVE